MTPTSDALAFLQGEIDKRGKRTVMSFEEYLELVREDPQRVLRNVFQLFHDMVKSHVGEGADEYPDDPESIGFVRYDCSKLFVEGSDSPFFADRLFANRFVRQVESLQQGYQQNRIYAYDGPSGCGKSTFLNNLLRAFEVYTSTREGQTFEVVWELDEDLLSGGTGDPDPKKHLIVPCPSHDHPILMIPKEQRVDFLNILFAGKKKGLSRILGEKTYEWLLRGELCTICRPIFWSSLERTGSLDKVFRMVRVRPYKFDRALGEGISIFNPGDKPMMRGPEGDTIGWYFTNKPIQDRLDQLFGLHVVRYVYSLLAMTNNGIYVLMDVKSHNRGRLLELHNVISEGVHKVGDVEEHINSLFFALMNPDDKNVIKEEKMDSLESRIQYNKIPFALEPATELSIWHSNFGPDIDRRFLPRVLVNFAKVIIGSRMRTDCPALKSWISDVSKYGRYCDSNGLLLRMEIYSGVIPEWLSEEDRAKFTAPVRRALIAEGEQEGDKGLSGRDSIRIFSEFFSRHSGRQGLINMDHVMDFFTNQAGRDTRGEVVPKAFLGSLRDSYNYAVLNEVKESLYEYNEAQVRRDILNYLCALDYEVGSVVVCHYTGEEVRVTLEFFKLMASRLTGKSLGDSDAMKFAQDTQAKYTTTRARELRIEDTDFYRDLFKTYKKNLKEKVLQPFIGNANFREAVKAFGSRQFETFDTRLREHVAHMIENLVQKFGYTEQGAKEICAYVLDKGLPEKFA